MYERVMFQRLPSPVALRTFEAAARLGSFKEAAAELGVTPTAVSHQIRALEESLGVALFVRRTRAVALTQAGQTLAPAVSAAFLGIGAAVEQISETARVLTVTTTAAFATLRLVPRLGDFEARWPALRLRVMTGTDVVDLRRDRHVDIAIRYAAEPQADLHVVPLLDETFGAYGAPALLDRLTAEAPPALIETAWQRPQAGAAGWSDWLALAGDGFAPPPRLLRYEEEHFVLQAAIAGQGLALMSDVLVEDAVARGLLAPYRPGIRLPGRSYAALCLKERAGERKIRRFLDWLEATYPGDGR